MNPTLRQHRKKRILIFVSVLFLLSLFIPTPYYLFQPGSVEELSSKVMVEDGAKSTEGNMYLTTVLSARANNIYYFAYGLLDPHTSIERTKTVKGDMSDAEYKRWLNHLMTKSQQQAMIAGLTAAGEKVNIKYKGLVVRTISEQSKAKDVIEVGDQIIKVDDKPTSKVADLHSYLKEKEAGESVTVQLIRDGKEKTEDITLISMDDQAVIDAGIGISLEEAVEIDSVRKVNIRAGDIGGPSAGLMFSLEIYNQINDGKVTKGYEIAGTGTIDENGSVGQIGGIREKIAAVDKAGVDLFFIPKDIKKTDSNEKEVKEEAKKYGYAVDIVPVSTLQEAIDYLEQLPEKL